jgi:GDPmannose 4,6-dehydratase
MLKRALILGIGGQDGSYLAEVLLGKDYAVHGLYRRSSVDNLTRIAHIRDRIALHQGDLADSHSINRLLSLIKPDEVYNEADLDHIQWSHHLPAYSLDITSSAVGRLLESIKSQCPKAKVFQPVSATMFGFSPPPQNETTPFDPRSPYACAKVCAYYLARHYRLTHGMHVCTAILYNHDSVRRSPDYLLHKICHNAVRIAAGKQETMELGDTSLRVDIGSAEEYMRVAHQIMQLPEPDDYVVGTGVAPSIKEMALCALRLVGVQNVDKSLNGARFSPGLLPGKQPTLVADPSKLEHAIGSGPWRSVTALSLIPPLVQHYSRTTNSVP